MSYADRATAASGPVTPLRPAFGLPVALLLFVSCSTGHAEQSSTAVNVVFTATGGSITQDGLYTAGPAAGTFQVVATFGGLTDTSTVLVPASPGDSTRSGLAPEPSPAAAIRANAPKLGIPFGPFGTWDSWAPKANIESFTLSVGMAAPEALIERINQARSTGVRLLLAMTGGKHSNYMTNGAFDLAKWQARMQAYNTPAIRSAVEAAVADGTIIGNSVMDEPHVYGLGDGNTWGPRGTMTKALVDRMCGYVKSIFPTLPAGVVHPHEAFEPEESYAVCEFLVDQYTYRKGSVIKFRDDALAMAKRDGIAVVFSLNVLNGGIQARRDGTWTCPIPTTEGRGTFQPNCRMTAEQVREWGTLLGTSGCALAMWRYDDDYMSKPEIQMAMKDVAARLANLAAKPCRRS